MPFSLANLRAALPEMLSRVGASSLVPRSKGLGARTSDLLRTDVRKLDPRILLGSTAGGLGLGTLAASGSGLTDEVAALLSKMQHANLDASKVKALEGYYPEVLAKAQSSSLSKALGFKQQAVDDLLRAAEKLNPEGAYTQALKGVQDKATSKVLTQLTPKARELLGYLTQSKTTDTASQLAKMIPVGGIAAEASDLARHLTVLRELSKPEVSKQLGAQFEPLVRQALGSAKGLPELEAIRTSLKQLQASTQGVGQAIKSQAPLSGASFKDSLSSIQQQLRQLSDQQNIVSNFKVPQVTEEAISRFAGGAKPAILDPLERGLVHLRAKSPYPEIPDVLRNANVLGAASDTVRGTAATGVADKVTDTFLKGLAKSTGSKALSKIPGVSVLASLGGKVQDVNFTHAIKSLTQEVGKPGGYFSSAKPGYGEYVPKMIEQLKPKAESLSAGTLNRKAYLNSLNQIKRALTG